MNLARDYSTRREAFGNVLKDYPLHIQTLARMEARFLIYFKVVRLWECYIIMSIADMQLGKKIIIKCYAIQFIHKCKNKCLICI